MSSSSRHELRVVARESGVEAEAKQGAAALPKRRRAGLLDVLSMARCAVDGVADASKIEGVADGDDEGLSLGAVEEAGRLQTCFIPRSKGLDPTTCGESSSGSMHA